MVAQAHLGDARAKIADLKAMERVLKETVARCAGSVVEQLAGAEQEHFCGWLLELVAFDPTS